MIRPCSAPVGPWRSSSVTRLTTVPRFNSPVSASSSIRLRQLQVFLLLRVNVLDQNKSLDVLGERVRNELNAGHHPEETAVGMEAPVFDLYFALAAVIFPQQFFPVKATQILRQVALIDIMA